MTTNNDITLMKKKALYKSLHRGCKETDILFERFVDKFMGSLNQNELMLYLEFLEETDADIYDWTLEKSNFPAKYQKFIELLRLTTN